MVINGVCTLERCIKVLYKPGLLCSGIEEACRFVRKVQSHIHSLFSLASKKGRLVARRRAFALRNSHYQIMALITLISHQLLLHVRYSCFRMHKLMIHSFRKCLTIFLLTVKLPWRQSLGCCDSRRKYRYQEHIHSCHTFSRTQCHCNPSFCSQVSGRDTDDKLLLNSCCCLVNSYTRTK